MGCSSSGSRCSCPYRRITRRPWRLLDPAPVLRSPTKGRPLADELCCCWRSGVSSGRELSCAAFSAACRAMASWSSDLSRCIWLILRTSAASSAARSFSSLQRTSSLSFRENHKQASCQHAIRRSALLYLPLAPSATSIPFPPLLFLNPLVSLHFPPHRRFHYKGKRETARPRPPSQGVLPWDQGCHWAPYGGLAEASGLSLGWPQCCSESCTMLLCLLC